MAKQTGLELFSDTDFTLQFAILNATETLAQDITGWALSWILKTDVHVADADAVLEKTTAAGGITITGTYNSSIASNTQRVVVTILDTDTASEDPGTYVYSLKRTDAGSEVVLAYGQLQLIKVGHD